MTEYVLISYHLLPTTLSIKIFAEGKDHSVLLKLVSYIFHAWKKSFFKTLKIKLFVQSQKRKVTMKMSAFQKEWLSSLTHLCSPIEMLPSYIFLVLGNNEDICVGRTELTQKTRWVWSPQSAALWKDLEREDHVSYVNLIILSFFSLSFCLSHTHWAQFIMACMHAKSFSHVRLFATLWTVAHQALLSRGFFQARILEWIAMSSSRESSQPRDQTCVS